MPMHPRNLSPMCKVTNTPQRSAKTPWAAAVGRFPLVTISTIADRASCRRATRSASRSESILGLLPRFHHVQFPALLDAVVQLAPEAPKVLRRGSDRANDHQPQKKQRQSLERGMARRDDQHRHARNLEHHLRFAE